MENDFLSQGLKPLADRVFCKKSPKGDGSVNPSGLMRGRKENTYPSLTRQCKLLKISRSSIYYTPVGFDPATIDPMHEIDRIFTKYPLFGSRQITVYLPPPGFSAGRHRVRRLMGIMGLQAIYKGANTSKKHPQHKIWPYLLRKLSITRPTMCPFQRCKHRLSGSGCSDITYILVKNGFLYLLAIMDWVPRKVLSWRLSNALPFGDVNIACRAMGCQLLR